MGWNGEVKVKQTYTNNGNLNGLLVLLEVVLVTLQCAEDVPIECTYEFPLDEEGVICALHVLIGTTSSEILMNQSDLVLDPALTVE